MDLRLTDEERAFRDEVRQFLVENVPGDIRGRMIERDYPPKDDFVRWTRILAEKGWSVPGWPVEYGGTGWSVIQQYIFAEELQRHPAPLPIAYGVNLVGPVLYTFGTEEQKKRFLPRIITLEDWWCQGFSEPGAGSDLAALSTRAVRDGEHYVVNGQKLWTTLAHWADWMFCLVQTDPSAAKRQEGISFLLIDMKTPGIEIRPIITIDGDHEVNEVFFTDVRVPVENLVGDENKGWDYAKFLLGHERTNTARIGRSKQRLVRIRELAALERAGGRPLIEDPGFRERLAATEIELKALELTQLRVVAADAKRGDTGKPDPASSTLKIKGSLIFQETTHLMMEVMGPYAMPDHKVFGEHLADELAGLVGPDYGKFATPGYFHNRAVSIYGGTTEIQKNIIAKTVLGL